MTILFGKTQEQIRTEKIEKEIRERHRVLKRKLLDGLVVYMLDNNDFDPFLFSRAEYLIELEGSSRMETDIKYYGIRYLYNQARNSAGSMRSMLESYAENLRPIHTVVPTPETVERQKMYREAMMRDYEQSQLRGWSTD